MNKKTHAPDEQDLRGKMSEIDADFKDFLADLKFIKRFEDTQLKTFSPLDVVSDFEQRGMQRVREVSVKEMMSNENGMRKLLVNMLSQCRPGALSDDDVEQLSGINGREVRGGL